MARYTVLPSDPLYVARIVMGAVLALADLISLDVTLLSDGFTVGEDLVASNEIATLSVSTKNKTGFNPKIVVLVQRLLAAAPRVKWLHLVNSLSAPEPPPSLPTLGELFELVPIGGKGSSINETFLKGFSCWSEPPTLPNLQSLTSLNLMPLQASSLLRAPGSLRSEYDGLRHTFAKGYIQLEELIVSVVFRGLLGYLSSYSGLIYLQFDGFITVDARSSDELTQVFYRTVFPKHVDSLEICWADAKFSGSWCFGDDWERYMRRCIRLRVLNVSLDMSVSQAQIDNTTVSCWECLFTRWG